MYCYQRLIRFDPYWIHMLFVWWVDRHPHPFCFRLEMQRPQLKPLVKVVNEEKSFIYCLEILKNLTKSCVYQRHQSYYSKTKKV